MTKSHLTNLLDCVIARRPEGPTRQSHRRAACFRFTVFGLLLTAAVFASGCALNQTKQAPILATVPSGKLTWQGDLPVLHLSGTPYEIGYQHGSLMPREVRASLRTVMAFVDREVGIPLIGKWLACKKLDQAWSKMKPFVPQEYLEEMEGLSAGAGIPLETLQRVHALPELMSTTCSGFAAFGDATKGGRLIQIRNLDWAIKSDVQRYAALFVYRPKEKRPFVSIGWLGFIGVVSGISENGISIGEIGSDTTDQDLKGIPMPFLLRRVLEKSGDLKEAANIVMDAPRTGGYNYLFADAKAKQAVAIETTKRHYAVFWTDQEPEAPYRVPVKNAIFRSDTSFDPIVRNLQISSCGDPSKPGLESPVGSGAYDIRYRGQGLLLRKFYGAIDPETAMAIARAIAPKSNVQSVVYAYPQIWVANAEGRKPAATRPYQEISLEELF